jgi:Protein of unknown function (DUF433)
VDFVLKLLGDGYTADDIAREYPELEKEDVLQAAQYAAWLASERTSATAWARGCDAGQEVASLGPEELVAFRRWFQRFDAEAWDRQMEADARDGKLDALAEEALSAHASGQSTELWGPLPPQLSGHAIGSLLRPCSAWPTRSTPCWRRTHDTLQRLALQVARWWGAGHPETW